MSLFKKFFVYSVMVTVIAWSFGLPTAKAAGNYPAGSLLALQGQSGAAVYVVNADGTKSVFPDSKTFMTWFSNYDKVVRVPVSELDLYPDKGAVTYRAGTKLVKHQNTAKVFAVEPNGVIRWITTEAVASSLYGANWATRVQDVIPGYFSSSYTAGADLTTAMYPTGSLVKVGTTTYYVDGTTRRPFANDAAFAANNFKTTDVITATSMTGYTDGSSITGAESALTSISGQGNVVVVPSGSLNVSLAASSPASGTIITDDDDVSGVSKAQALATFGVFNFTAGSDGAAVVKTVKFTRGGVSADTDLDTLYLFDGTTRVAEGGSISGGVVTFNNPNGLFTVPAGTTKAISLKGDVAYDISAGKTISFGINAAADVTTGGTVGGSFPARGNVMTVAVVNDLGSLKVATGTPSGANTAIDPNQVDVEVATLTLTAENQKLSVEKLVLTEIGSVQVGDLTNFKLLAAGNQVATAEMANDYTVTFDMSAAPLEILNGNNKVLSVRANIVKGSTRTFYFSVQYRSDIVAKDTNYGVYIWPRDRYVTTGVWSPLKPTGTYLISSGSVTVNKSVDSPSTSVALDASNVTLAKFDFKATGEDVKVQNLNVRADKPYLGLDNGKIFVDGVQVGSTKDLTDANGDGTGDVVNFTFGSSFIVPAGVTKVVSVVADTKTAAGGSYGSSSTSTTIYLTTGSSNGQGMSSLQTTNVPSANKTANQLTLTGSSLTVSKYSGYGNQTMVAGTVNAKVGSFVFNTGAASGVNLTSITVSLTGGEPTSISNLLIKRNDTGAQFGTTKGSPSTSNVFNGTVNIPAASLVIFDLYADIQNGIPAGDWAADVEGNGTSAVDGNTVTASVQTLQTITIGNGSLTLSAGTHPDAANLIAGTSGNWVGQFRFNAANTAYTINKFVIGVPNNFATSTASMTIEYPKADGSTGSMTSVVVSGDTGTLYASFVGVGMYVAKDAEALVNVKLALTSIASGATSGVQGNVTFVPNSNFEAVNTAGVVIDNVGSTSYTGSNYYVRKSVPTFARVALSNTPLSDEAIFKFTVVADSAGTIDIKQLGFTVTTAGSVSVTSMKLYNSETGLAITDTGVNADGSGNVKLVVGAEDDDVLSIGTTAKTYDVRGTVTAWGTGDQISVKFKEDTAVIGTPTNSAYNDDSITLRAANYNIWSDRSASTHTTITTDWTNGYLLKNMNGTQTYNYAS